MAGLSSCRFPSGLLLRLFLEPGRVFRPSNFRRTDLLDRHGLAASPAPSSPSLQAVSSRSAGTSATAGSSADARLVGLALRDDRLAASASGAASASCSRRWRGTSRPRHQLVLQHAERLLVVGARGPASRP